ncbi:hypothetical protein B0J11DRAFT_569824 [Dendryphion nanum]|uniref:Uncharacterized protein n=1 Tax=Dendryphion nanum TaxID=256645 RepID=A0A9P9DM31_9PLEO|nr:hypothetical protein B0J11DRAFT_569824 [Dendryphion nanum]
MAMEKSISFVPVLLHTSTQHTHSKMDISHLSGATMADITTEPKIQLIAASEAGSNRSSMSKFSSNSKRCSVASTTKSELRRSNNLLIEMLQNIQTELNTHRTIMLDIQHRVSHLEHESVASIDNESPHKTALHALESNVSKQKGSLVPPESQFWWQTCKNFAQNADPPMSATEFLKTPRRFSGLTWEYGVPSRPQSPPITLPDVEDIPPLTPTSEEDDASDPDTPVKANNKINKSDTRPLVSRLADNSLENNIVEQMVEMNKKNLPAPPTLQTPPPGRSAAPSVAPELPKKNPLRYYKGVKSVATYKAIMKNKNTEKQHFVLVHFHRRADLANVEDET